MTLGEKIRKYRILKGWTQKDLGLAVGFSASTADSRIRKYEKDLMAPKGEIRAKLADVLDVDLAALSDIDIRTNEDVMQALFLFEDLFFGVVKIHEAPVTFFEIDLFMLRVSSFLSQSFQVVANISPFLQPV